MPWKRTWKGEVGDMYEDLYNTETGSVALSMALVLVIGGAAWHESRCRVQNTTEEEITTRAIVEVQE